MSIPLDTRQSVQAAVVTVLQTELPTGVPTVVFDVPQGSIVIGGYLIIDTAFDSSTSDTIDVGYTTPDDTDDPDAYLNGGADNGSTTGDIVLVPTGRHAVGSEQITIENTAGGTEGTAGVCTLVVEYVVVGRSTENYG